jgi:hypothetical protein
MKNADYWISHLDLKPHPEGGFYKETYKSKERFPGSCLANRYGSPRPYGTSILFLITSENFSSFHQLKSDEVWHFYDGSPLTLYLIKKTGVLETHKLGNQLAKGESLQVLMPHNHWFAGEVQQEGGYALVGCTVFPGFEFDDLILGSTSELCNAYPQHRPLISRLTRLP